jgi:anti-sigma28 factor (negative regulator of flagellin synthesis)
MAENKKSSQLGNNMILSGSAREEKIRAIKQAVEAGTYMVSDRELADSLLTSLFWEQWENLVISKR